MVCWGCGGDGVLCLFVMVSCVVWWQWCSSGVNREKRIFVVKKRCCVDCGVSS